MKKQQLHVGDVISTPSAADGRWLDGEVVSLDPVRVMYKTGTKEVDLTAVEYKVIGRKSWRKRLRGTGKVASEDEQASKALLGLIQNSLLQFENKLVASGLMKKKVEWRRAWRASLDHAYETVNIALMVDVTSQIASQLKADVTSPWWNKQNLAWRESLSHLGTSRELESLVTDLTEKAVSWSSTSSQAFGKHSPREASGSMPSGGNAVGDNLPHSILPDTKQVDLCLREGDAVDEAIQRNDLPGHSFGTQAKVVEDQIFGGQPERQDAGDIPVESSAVSEVCPKKPLKRLRKVGEQVDLRNEGRSLRSKRQKAEVGQTTVITSTSVHTVDLNGLLESGLPQIHVKEEMLDCEVKQGSPGPLDRLETEVSNSVDDSGSSSGEDSSDSSDDHDSMYSSESSSMKGRLRSKARSVASRVSERIREKRKPDRTRAQTVSSKKTRQTTGLSVDHQKSSGDSGVVDFSASDDDSEWKEPHLDKYHNKVTRVKGQKTAPAPAIVDTSPAETDELCAICQFSGAAELMLLCDHEGCEYACHTFCLKPPLHAVPEEDWVCPHCSSPPGKRKAKGAFASKEIEKLLGRRLNTSKKSAEALDAKYEYLVKWRSYSHHHDTWVPEEWLSFYDRTRLLAFRRKHPLKEENKDVSVDDRSTEWLGVDRVIAYRMMGSDGNLFPQASNSTRNVSKPSGSDAERYEYLVKWKGMEYDAATWETCTTDDIKAAISRFEERHEKADTQSMQSQNLAFTNLKVQPDYVNGGVLHNYQLTGLKWLLGNFLERKSVILADEMGLGKTIQAAAFMVCAKRELLTNKPFLVIAPKSTLSGWEQELHTWATSLNCLVYHGEKDARTIIQKYEFYTVRKKPLFDVLVTSYELAMIDSSTLQKFQWSTIIVDEGHRVKNFQCKLSILLKRQHSDFRVLLTGTPVQNTLAELFALLHFLDPSEFPDPDDAACEFGHVDAIGTSSLRDAISIQEQVSRIHELLRPRMLRRLKTEVLRDMLPGKKLIEVPCGLTPYQRRLYITILKKNYKELNKGVKNGQKRSLNSILMDLKMCCNHPYLFPGKEPKHLPKEEEYRLLVEASGKFQLLDKLLPLLKDEGHRVLLFSQMTKMLDIIEDFLTFLGFSFCRIDGSTSSADRVKQITEFNNPKSTTFVFLISTRAGGLGINLPSADTVIIYDPDFNPFVDLQAQARAHRIGQVKTVLVYQLITKCSVEEKILQRSRKKLAMENLVMSSTAKETTQDLNELLLHGARSVLDEHNLEATSVRYTDEDLKQLLSRDISQSGVDIVETTGYLGAIQTPEDNHNRASKYADGSVWDELLGGVTEQREVPEELGRGKRSKKAVTYAFEPNLEDEDDCSQDNESEESSGSEVSLDPEEPPSPSMLGRCKTNVQAFDQEGSSVERSTLNHFPQSGFSPTIGTLDNPLLQGLTVSSASITNVIPPQTTCLELGRMLNPIQQSHLPALQANAAQMKPKPHLNLQTQPGAELGFHFGTATDKQGHMAAKDVTSFSTGTGQFLQVPPPTIQRQSLNAGSQVNASRPELVEVLSSFRRYVEAMNASCLQTKNISAGGDLTALGSLPPSTSPCSSSASIRKPELLNRPLSSSMLFMKRDTCEYLAPQISTKKLEDLKLQVVPSDSVQPTNSEQLRLARTSWSSPSVEQSFSSLGPVFPLEAKGIYQAADLDTGLGTFNVACSSDVQTSYSDVLSCTLADSLVDNPFSRKVPESAVPVNTAGVCQKRSNIPCSLASQHTLVAVHEAKQDYGAEMGTVVMGTSETVGTSTTKAKSSHCVKATFQQSSKQLQVQELMGSLGCPAGSAIMDLLNKNNVVTTQSSDSPLPAGSSGVEASPLVNGVTGLGTRPVYSVQRESFPLPAVLLPSQVAGAFPAVVSRTAELEVPRELSGGCGEMAHLCDSVPLLQLERPSKTCPPACHQTSESCLTLKSPYSSSGAADMESHPPLKRAPDVSQRSHSLLSRCSRDIATPKKGTTKQEPRKPLWVPIGDAGVFMFQSPRQEQQNFGLKTKASELVASPEPFEGSENASNQL